MAAKSRLLKNTNEFLSEIIYDERNEAEKKRIAELDALEKAEAEKKMRRRTEAAIIIQKHWRGYVGRKYYKECLLKYFRQISLKHYNSMATKIQKVWRGNWIRQHVYNYYKRQEYFQALAEKNEIMLTRLQEFRDERRRVQYEMARTIQRRHQNELVRKYHHLVSTKAIPGIYNSPYSPADSRDLFLKSAKIRVSPVSKKRKQKPFNKKCEKMLDSIKNFPNVPKQQGPFQDPKKVQFQQYKPPRQTLRMETDFYHLEKARKAMMDKEWTHRLHDDLFLPVKNRASQYKANMQNMSVYIPLGQITYRENDPSLNVDKKDFQLVLSPIPFFDEFQEKMEELKLEKFAKLTENVMSS